MEHEGEKNMPSLRVEVMLTNSKSCSDEFTNGNVVFTVKQLLLL
jgi:hypothetical protein